MTSYRPRVAIMQPYFLPYIGYFQLIQAVDQFVIYDNIKYTKKGWINRNRFLQNGKDKVFSIALKAGADSMDIVQRVVSESFDRSALLKQFEAAYRKAPHFYSAFPVIEKLVCYESTDLFSYILNSVRVVCAYLDIGTDILISSSLDIDRALSGQGRVIAICKYTSAAQYINAIGGQELYDPSAFQANGLALNFLKSRPYEYAQFGNSFVPWLSIVDVMMFNPVQSIKAYLANGYDLV